MKIQLLASLFFYGIVNGKDWFETPYGDEDFIVRAPYLSNVSLVCQDRYLNFSATAFQHWILPDLTILRANERKSFFTIDGYASWVVNSDGSMLAATIIYDQHFGFYHCAMDFGAEVKYVKRAINIYGPTFTNLWEEYYWPTIIGLSSLGTYIVIVVAIGLIYNFLIKRRKQATEIDTIEMDNSDNYVGTSNTDQTTADIFYTGKATGESLINPSYQPDDDEPKSNDNGMVIGTEAPTLL